MKPKTLIIDNYDSFSYNIYQIMAEINGLEPDIVKNDAFIWEDLCEWEYSNIIISPGPGHPNNEKDFGICKRILVECHLPILGVCLGHQGIACAYGGNVIPAKEAIHGQACKILHKGHTLFDQIPKEFNAVRYHSLIVDRQLPDSLATIAWSLDGVIMGLAHKIKPIWGIQFHPESICTEYGYNIFKNFKKLAEEFHPTKKRKPRRHIPKSIHNENFNKAEVECFKLLVETVDFEVDTSLLYQAYCSNQNTAIWLDSSLIRNDMSSISIMGCMGGPHSYRVKYDVNKNQIQILSKDNTSSIPGCIFTFLEQKLSSYKIELTNLPIAFQCGFVGYFGYELKQNTTCLVNQHFSLHPDAQFVFLDRAIVYDHKLRKCYLMALYNDQSKHSALHWIIETRSLVLSCPRADLALAKNVDALGINYKLERNQQHYLDDIKKCLHFIRAGESYEICLTNRICIKESLKNPLSYYLFLRETNPAPYSAFLKFDDFYIASSSMERFLRIDDKGFVETKPIKGTMRRGGTEAEDQEIINILKNHTKSKSENLMIVDLLRNDLGAVCEVGSVQVTKLMDVETYSTVHHLVTTVNGQLRQDMSAIDCIKSCFPGGSMTGAPKIRTLEIIDQLETSPRGVYSGSIGYLSLNGAVDLNIVIRTALITRTDISIGVGGGIVNLSNPEEEFDEIILKAKPLLLALACYKLVF